MTSVVRDQDWNAYFREARRQGEPNPEKMADSIWRFRVRSVEANECIGRVKVLTKAPVVIQASKMTARCQALNLNNTPCQFKAVCGKFCKKHKIVVP